MWLIKSDLKSGMYFIMFINYFINENYYNEAPCLQRKKQNTN